MDIQQLFDWFEAPDHGDGTEHLNHDLPEEESPVPGSDDEPEPMPQLGHASMGAEFQGLREHQIVAVQRMAWKRFVILADDMGLGKTRTSIAACKWMNLPMHVICPPSLIENWKQELKVMKYEAVLHSWAKQPKEIDGTYALVADEAHLFQNLASGRTKQFLKLASQAEAVFPLTGTPMRNGRPVNMLPLLVAIRHPISQVKKEYEMRYCNGRWTVFGKFWLTIHNMMPVKLHWKCPACGEESVRSWNWKQKEYRCSHNRCYGKVNRPIVFWDANGATNTDELREKTKGQIIRRLKSQCLDLPPKTRVIRQVEVTKQMASEYKRRVDDAKSRFQDRVRRGLIEDAEVLAAVTFIRQAASVAKVQAADDLIEEVVEQGGQVVVMAEFVETARKLADNFQTLAYTGELKRVDKHRLVERFQKGMDRVFVGTRQAAGVGLNLTAASTIIMVDRPFVPEDVEQAEDRLNRMGQRWAVTSIWLQAFEVCKRIDEQLEDKDEIRRQVIAGENVVVKTAGIRARKVLGQLLK